MYKECIRRKVRFQTPKGVLSVEQVQDLSMADIATCLTAINGELKSKGADSELTFLSEVTVEDTENQLRFAILKDTYLTKKAELEKARTAASDKIHNQKILSLIAEKQENKMKDMSVEELEKLLK